MADITLKAKEYEQKKKTEEALKPKGFSPDDLLKALYWAWDVFERSNVEMFCVGNTAKAVKNQEPLYGHRIDIGIRHLEWVSGGKRLIDSFAGSNQIKETEDLVIYETDKVPVYLHLYDDDISITQCDTVVYFYESFKLPNPYEQFEKRFGQL